MRILIGIILTFISFGLSAVSAEEFPFVDVNVGDTYYNAVKSLYENRMIFDDGSHKFRPNERLTRDMFVGISMSVSCEKCLHPKIEDIVGFEQSPFIDLKKDNLYYYCIAQGDKNKLIPAAVENPPFTCSDGQSYSEKPFCISNTTSRIEAVAFLLRQANLWNDTLNANVTQNTTITDVTQYWYGYAQKGIEAGILTLKDTKVNPDEPITRGEFAMMSAKMLDYNQCIKPNNNTTIWSYIEVQGKGGSRLNRSIFTKDAVFSLIGISKDASLDNYSWKAVDSVSGKVISHDGISLPSGLLGIGNWYIEGTVSDATSGEKLSTSMMTLVISDGNGTLSGSNSGATGVGNGDGRDENGNGGIGGIGGTGDVGVSGILYPSLSLVATPMTPGVGSTVTFKSYSLGNGPLTYTWDFGDGIILNSGNTGSTNHIYSTPGIYTATLTMIDGVGKSALGTLVIEIGGKNDKDSDGIEDALDVCPDVKGTKDNKGCPVFQTNTYTQGGFISANTSLANNSLGNANISAQNATNSNSQTIAANTVGNVTGNVAGNISGNVAGNANVLLGNALNTTSVNDTDSDGISDALDACPTISGNSMANGCPLVGSFLGNIEKNACIMGQLEQMGGIIIEPVCTVCPCPTSISLGNAIRKCDIIFPAILSKDLSTIYSRGTLYQIQ